VSTLRRIITASADVDKDINAKDAHGFSGLYHAAMFGHVDCMMLLLNAGACISSPDLGGLSVLHIASEKGQLPAVRLLIERGADLSARDSIGRTPRDWAESKGHVAISRILDEWAHSRPTASGVSSAP
jgi:ankyrin repeat protein